jgi:hypothetical protein
MRRLFLIVCGLVSGVSIPSVGYSDEEGIYSIFNPKPKKEMRSFSTDRPTKAPSPYTIDGGHLLIESDVVNYTQTGLDEYNYGQKTVFFLSPTLRAGLLDWLELQYTPPAYTMQVSSLGGSLANQFAGFGDSVARLKVNVVGNNAGVIALGIMPYVKIPNSKSVFTNNTVEAGIILPGSAALSSDCSLGFMAQWDYKKNALNSSYHSEGQASAYISYTWVDGLSTYLESYWRKSFETGSLWVSTADVGFVYKASSDIQLDLGANIGVTEAADDINPFFGLSWRI